MAETKHFFFHSTDDNGDSLDWFIEAIDAREAQALWAAAVENAGMDFGEYTSVHIWQLPALTGVPSFINWNNDTPQDGHPFLTIVVVADTEG